MLENTKILGKLKEKRINEVKIINLKEDEIRKFKFLTESEKEILSRKVTTYNLSRDPHAINYSPSLTKFFVKKKCEKILEKMRTKKVKETKLLSLFSKEIRDLSFLTE